MTLSLCRRVMSSVHSLIERNIWVKFKENHSTDSGDMERTQKRRVNPMTLKCDPDLESA